MANSGQETRKVKKYRHLYGRDEDGEEKKVQYELAKLPLQDEVAGMRRVATLTWSYMKFEKLKLNNATRKSLEAARTKVKGGLDAVGAVDSSVALQIGAIGTAAIVGVFLARKKSTLHRVLYPTTAGVLAWTSSYMALPQNREHAQSQINRIRKSIINSIKSK